MAISQDEFDFEGTFGTQLGHTAPRLNSGLKDHERKIVQPQERLAAWLGRGYGVLAFTTLLLLALMDTNTHVWALSLVPCSILLLAFVPFLGKRPLASPLRLLSAMLILGVTVGPISCLAQGLVDFRYQNFHASGFLYNLADLSPLYLEQLVSLGVVLPVTLLGLLLYNLGRSLLREFPWVDSRLGLRGVYRYASGFFLATLCAVLVLPPLYVEWKVSNLEWPDTVLLSDRSSTAEKLKLGRYTFHTFQDIDSESHAQLLQEMTDEEFLLELAEVNSRIRDAEEKVVPADFLFFRKVIERIGGLKSTSEEALEFLFLVPNARHRFRRSGVSYVYYRALFKQSQLLVELKDLNQLDHWSKMLEEIAMEDMDGVALDILNEPSRRGHWFVLLSTDWRSFFTEMLDRFKSKAILLDYSARRGNPLEEGENPSHRLDRGHPTTLWPEKPELDSFCTQLCNRYFKDPQWVKALIDLRRHKLERGIYPQEAPAALRGRYKYTSQGEQALLEFTYYSQDHKWILR